MLRQAIHRFAFSAALVAAVALGPGCVRRTATFTTVPEGVRVILNDREIGRTPATVEFTWYGDYDVVYRLKGFQTVKTNVVLNKPVYQLFPLDFFAEVLWPGELHDHHDIPVQELTPLQLPERDELVERAKQFRDRALFEGGTSAQTD